MLKKTLVTVVALFCVAGLQAQTMIPAGMLAQIADETVDLLSPEMEPRAMETYATEYGEILKRRGVTEETVGDPYSFGREKTYLGVVQVRSVALRDDCTGYPPEAPCVELGPAPAVTFVDEMDLGTIELPRRATNSILCFTFTPFASWEWNNMTPSQQTAQMWLRPKVRIESEVLDDPSLIDPGTGLPFNGVLLETTISTFLQSRTLDPNEYEMQFNATTRSCTGGLVNVRVLRDSYGLSDRVIREFFRNPITVSFGLYGQVSMVTSGSYSTGVRLYGD